MSLTQVLAPVEVNLTCVRGDTSEFDLVVTKSSLNVDLTGAKVWFTARRGQGGSLVFQKTSEVAGGITIDADQVTNKGQCVIKLASTDTSVLAAETVTLYYDIQVKTLTDLWTVNYGALVVTPDATTEIV